MSSSSAISARRPINASLIVKALIFPVVFASSLYLFNRALQAGVPGGLALFGLSTLNMAVVAVLEILFPLRREWAWWRDRETINDLIHGGLMSVVGPWLGQAALGSIVTATAAALAADGHGVWPTHWPFMAQFALAVVIYSFIDWAKHWVYHHWSPAWAIHALHHNPDKMHVAKAGRLHFLESTLRYALINAPLLALGAPGEVLLWLGALGTTLGNLNHSNIDMPMPGFMHYLFATPGQHRLHHSSDRDLGASNLSPYIMLPDLLFGTFRHSDKHPLIATGIEEDPIPHNVVGQVASPFVWPWLVNRLRRGAGASAARA